jgi:hypothetical protein
VALVATIAASMLAGSRARGQDEIHDAQAMAAEAAFEAGNFSEADSRFEKLYEETRLPAYLRNWARSRERLGDCSKALELFERYLHIKGLPENKQREVSEAIKSLPCRPPRKEPVGQTSVPPTPPPPTPPSSPEPPVSVPPPPPSSRPPLGEPVLWFALAVGTGGGWTNGRPEVNDNANHTLDSEGVALAPLLHLSPEVGYFLSPGVVLSAQLRFQFVTGATDVTAPEHGCQPCTTADTAVAGLARTTWLFGDEKDWLVPWVSAGAGYGKIRHVISIPLKGCGTTGDSPCRDTALGGSFFLGPAAGVGIRLAGPLVLVAGLSMLVGVPHTMVNLDVNVGLAGGFGGRALGI